jgi:16S rRNA G527 N7-methylase RsmG
MIRLLNLDNLEIILSGDEKYKKRFDFSVSRAFGATRKFADVADHFLARNGVVLAMKGKKGEEDLEREIPLLEKRGWKVAFKDRIQLPVIGHERFIFGLKKFVSRETFP